MVKKIKELCKKRGISISKLERETGLGNGIIGKWEKFGREPKYVHLKTIADYLNVPVSELTGEEQKKEPPAQSGELMEIDKRLIEWFRSLPPEKQRAILISQDAPKDLID